MWNDSTDRFIDANISRKGKILRQNLEGSRVEEISAPFFPLIEFNLSGLCNRTCVFCPRANPAVYPNVNEHIPAELYEKTMKELAEVDYDGMILYSAFSEPLLYKRIEVLIKMSKEYCPKVRVEATTDGDFVTPDKMRTLFDAGLDTLMISLYDGPDQVGKFQAIMAEAEVTEPQVILRERWLPPDKHFGITLSNRAGMVEIPEIGVVKLAEPIKRPCYYPFYQVLVDYDGSVLLCPHDWAKKLIVGNLNRQSIHELWDSRVMKRVRYSLAKADRNFPPCDKCDVDGTLMGKAHFEEWMKYYGQIEALPE